MRSVLAFLLLGPALGATAAQAQTDYYGRLGLTYATRLVTDHVVQEVDTRQSLAPTLVLGVSLPFSPAYRAGLEGTLASSGYHSTSQDQNTDLGTLRTASVLLGLEGPVWQRVSWRAGVGLLRYWPAEDEGIFLQGGTTRFLAGAGFDYRPRLLTNWDLMISLRYDFHRFSTDELRARGFSGTQGVQRISASVGLARARR
jgi:hypothetical protein